ncbi:unnamed protein product [Symbiodinium pilosum]|uniref:Uncharacterized protein n=1 Tax=Symbiodinium pilosum TaxID=2952 RepID=A0A812QSU7_SYMPI|nr:unnamed protein product [Symbiodinium pilosum]
MDAPVWEQHVSSINLDEAALEVLRSVDGHTSIFWRLPSKTGTAGSALNHAINVVKSTLEAKAPMSFKLGYTHNPSWRWDNTLYGYKHDLAYKFQAMLVLCISEEPHSAAMMEAALISYFKGTPGCQNVRAGGDNVKTDPMASVPLHMVYWVYRSFKGRPDPSFARGKRS